eukprot:6174638-Pleurochrysis_carterae.AAC.1
MVVTRRGVTASPAGNLGAGSKGSGTPNASPATKRPTRVNAPSPAKPSIEYEFGGPLGAALVMLGLPLVVMFLYGACSAHGCVESPRDLFSGKLQQLASALSEQPLWDWHAVAVVFGWSALQGIMYVILPGPVALGVVSMSTSDP